MGAVMPPDETPAWALRMREAREAAGMSQSEVGRRLGINPGTVNRYEQGRSEPGGVRFVEIAVLLRVSAEWLVYGAARVDPRTDPPHWHEFLDRHDVSGLTEVELEALRNAYSPGLPITQWSDWIRLADAIRLSRAAS